MAIAYDNYLGYQSPGTPSSVTQSFTTSGSNRALLVGIHIEDVSDTISGVTYAGVSMTEVPIGNTSFAGGGGRTERIYLYYLAAPASGANDIVASATGTISNAFDLYAISYTGVNQTTPVDDSEKNSTTGTTVSPSPAPTSTVSGDWAVSFVRSNAGSITNGTNYTGRGADTSIEMGDSNASVGGAGSITVSAGAPSGSIMIITALIMESGASSSIKTFDGLAYASTKTVNGLAIASVKTWAGLA